MISYFGNRHYQKLTEVLPPELRGIQPSTIYYKSFQDHQTLDLLHKNQQLTYRTIGKQITTSLNNNKVNTKNSNGNRKLTIKKRKALNINIEQINMNACPLCFEEHIEVAYYGYRHICVKCRNFVRDQYGNQIKIFLQQNKQTKQNQIICLGVVPKEINLKQDKKSYKYQYYLTDHTKLEVMNMGVYATFANNDQLVLIVRQNPQKNYHKKNKKITKC